MTLNFVWFINKSVCYSFMQNKHSFRSTVETIRQIYTFISASMNFINTIKLFNSTICIFINIH